MKGQSKWHMYIANIITKVPVQWGGCSRKFRNFPFFPAPQAPPSAIQGNSTSSTSIFVQWERVPSAYQNGRILSYTVSYKALPLESSRTKVVSAPIMNTTLTGLNEYTTYSITVAASTIKGSGPFSVPVGFTTEEDSKLHWKAFLY